MWHLANSTVIISLPRGGDRVLPLWHKANLVLSFLYISKTLFYPLLDWVAFPLVVPIPKCNVQKCLWSSYRIGNWYMVLYLTVLKNPIRRILGWKSSPCFGESVSNSVRSNSATHMKCSLPGSSVHGIFQERILKWVAIPFSRGSSQPRDWTWVSCIAGRFFTIWVTSLETQFIVKLKDSEGHLNNFIAWQLFSEQVI